MLISYGCTIIKYSILYNRRYSNTPESNIKLDLAYEFDHSSVVCCVRFSKDGKYLATGSNRKAQIFSVADGSQVALVYVHYKMQFYF